MAVPTGAFWVEVDNGGATDGFASVVGFRTFDLFVQLEAGDVLFAADFGIAGPNAGLTTSQTVFNHPFGADTRSPALNEGAFPATVYDTFVALGDADGQNGEVSTPVGAIDWNPAGFNGVWSVSVPLPGQAGPNLGDAAWLARVTVSSAGAAFDQTGATEFLGGEFFVSGTGPNGDFGQAVPSDGVVSVGNAFPQVPTPGAFALLGLAGVATTRRRR